MYKHFEKDPKGEEKKLTDEEIVKDIECSTGMPSYWKKIVLDLIHRLQNDITEKDIELERARNAINERDEWYAEQKAEIERLTEENEYLDGCAKQFLADYQKCEIANVELQQLNAKYYNEAKDLRRENEELQKQVDELKKDREAIFNEMSERMKVEVAIEKKLGIRKCEQAVKDTAKEILTELIEKAHFNGCIDLTVNEVKAWFREDYGVEVE